MDFKSRKLTHNRNRDGHARDEFKNQQQGQKDSIGTWVSS